MVSVHRRKMDEATVAFPFCLISRFIACYRHRLETLQGIFIKSDKIFLSNISLWTSAVYRPLRPIYGKISLSFKFYWLWLIFRCAL